MGGIPYRVTYNFGGRKCTRVFGTKADAEDFANDKKGAKITCASAPVKFERSRPIAKFFEPLNKCPGPGCKEMKRERKALCGRCDDKKRGIV